VGPLSIEQVLADEATALHGVTQRSVVEALRAHAAVQPAQSRRAHKDADTRSGEDQELEGVQRRRAFYCALNKLNRSTLCLSGGGIRSATFCLGVVQALAMHNRKKVPPGATADTNQSTDEHEKKANQSWLSHFHYLSTVSGGGYIGSWLSAWRQRDDFPTVWRNLTSRPDGSDIEPPEISWLRAYSNYLTPRVGISSADSWADVAIYLRNLMLNWLVIVPVLALALLGLKLVVTLSIALARIGNMWWPHFAVALLGIALLVVVQAFTTRHRPTRRKPPDPPPSVDAGNSIKTLSYATTYS
jgi:Patatin-like phospholipase